MFQVADWVRILATLPHPAALLSGASGIIEASNPKFAGLLDLATDELVGKQLASWTDAADRIVLLNALAGGTDAKSFEIRVSRPRDGRGTLELGLGAVLEDGRRLVFAREIRTQERSQRKLLQYFRDAIDSVGHMVAIFDADDRMIAHNRNYREGYRVGDRDLPPEVSLEGKTYRECMELRVKYKLHREFLDQPWKFVEDRVRQHNRDNAQTITLANGQTLKVEKRTLPDGVRVIVGTDITEIAEGERKRRDLEAQLHHSQKVEALGTLAGGITHDLNNTLVPIVALSKLTARRFEAGTPLRNNLDTIYEASERARDLVRRVLAFSRKEEPDQQQEANLADVVREALKLMRATVPTSIQLDSEIVDVPN